MQVMRFDDQTTRTLLHMLEYAKHMYGIDGSSADTYSAFAKAEGVFKRQSKLPVQIPVTFVDPGIQHINVTVK